jgi:16S rRNA (cytidine1402-2'-O)-methyltransferase
MKLGKLYLIPTPISGTDLNDTLTKKDIEIVKKLNRFIVETPKVARSYLTSLDLKFPIQEIEMDIYDEHSDEKEIQDIVQPLLKGEDIGLMTDAGTPCIADPGEEIVLICHRLGIQVIPMIGPSSIFLTLMASGLNSERFTFNGYLPRKPDKRQAELNRLVVRVEENSETQIFMEAPYRNQVLFEDILNLDSELFLSLGIKVNSPDEEILTMPISKWKERNRVLDKVPIIFIIGKQ